MKNILINSQPKAGATSYLCSKLKKTGDSIEFLADSLYVTDYFKRHSKVKVHRTISSLCNSLEALGDKSVKVVIDNINMLTNANIKLLVKTMEKFSDRDISFILIATVGGKEGKKSTALKRLISESSVGFETEYTIVREADTNLIKDSTGKVIKDITSIVKNGFKPILR